MRNSLQDKGGLDSGVYIAVLYVAEDQVIRVGRLGQFRFRRGVYFYVGSAQRNLSARLERHNRKKKALRWHIDYLSVKAEMLGAITIEGGRELECQLAKKLSKMFELAVPGFGASDCRWNGSRSCRISRKRLGHLEAVLSKAITLRLSHSGLNSFGSSRDGRMVACRACTGRWAGHC
ncbi:MAG: GIY-YIG nuclease family protein [Sedimentisphaerales bacterium]|nr:GIY-YIG nuclease family protein [Sedimentisphaerales bacterium]